MVDALFTTSRTRICRRTRIRHLPTRPWPAILILPCDSCIATDRPFHKLPLLTLLGCFRELSETPPSTCPPASLPQLPSMPRTHYPGGWTAPQKCVTRVKTFSLIRDGFPTPSLVVLRLFSALDIPWLASRLRAISHLPSSCARRRSSNIPNP
jgi:hypothetical protein